MNNKTYTYLYYTENKVNHFCSDCRSATHIHSATYIREMRTNLSLLTMGATDDLGRIDPLTLRSTCCLECGAIHRGEELIVIKSDLKMPSIYLDSTVQYTEDAIKLFIFGKYMSFFNESIQENYYMSYINFNLNSGRVTALKPIDKDGNPIDYFADIPKFRNIGFGNAAYLYDMDFANRTLFIRDILSKIYPQVSEAFKMKFGYAPPFMSPDEGSALRWDSLCLIHKENPITPLIRSIRFHGLDPFTSRALTGYESNAKVRRKMSRVKFNLDNQLDRTIRLFTKEKLPKTIRMAVSKDFNRLFVLDVFKPIKTTDSLLKAISMQYRRGNSLQQTDAKKSFESFYNCYLRSFVARERANGNVKIKQEKIEAQAETILANRLNKINDTTAYDLFYQTYRVLLVHPEYTLDTTVDFEFLHDLVSADFIKATNKNAIIPYEDSHYNLEDSIDNFKFELALDTASLKIVGKRMNICVGSYDNRAVMNTCVIVFVRDDSDKVKACIELSGDCKTVYQVKANSNGRTEGELRLACQKWINSHKIKISTHDITPLQEVA